MLNLAVLIFLAIPIVVWLLIMLLSLPEVVESEQERRPISELYAEGAPRFTRDYTGRLWVERRRRDFFRPIRQHRRAPPPGDEE